ncbi:MAG: DNA methyltransferase [Armatimonadota bacterium]|nr:DNA methyltransferase [Armatimonadota bacterium]
MATLPLFDDDNQGRKRRGPKKGISKPLPYCDLDLACWKEYPEVDTDSLWVLKGRAKGDGHKLDYHGNFIPQIATQIFTRYSKTGDIVLDMFLGSGTSAIEAVNMDRRCVGVELKENLAQHVRGKIPRDKLGSEIRIIQGDSASSETVTDVKKTLQAMGAEHAQLLMLHPPYADIIKFSDLPEDLSNAESTDDFLKMFRRVAKNGYDLLEPGRFAALVIGDKYAAGELVPLGFLCMQQMNDVGFKTKSIIVKNIEGNEKGKGKSNNLWRYRALAGGFYIFKHEYVMVFRKLE